MSSGYYYSKKKKKKTTAKRIYTVGIVMKEIYLADIVFFLLGKSVIDHFFSGNWEMKGFVYLLQ